MKLKKVFGLLILVFCTVFLGLIVNARRDNTTEIIYGGVEGAFIRADSTNLNNQQVDATPEPTPDIWPVMDEEMWQEDQYRLVNEKNLLSSSFYPEIDKIFEYNAYFNVVGIDSLNAMIKAINDQGWSVIIRSAYKGYDYQNTLFNGTASQIWYGNETTMTYEEAVEIAKVSVMLPGASEHQLGLAVDIFDKYYPSPLTYSNMNKDFYAWLDEHCAEFGFIKRYPTRKYLLTGYDEPWHYRYVGKEIAAFIMEQGICYEEFYAHYNEGYTFN